nr:immunoglobulin heavy chain junction region [Mus musculus]MBK4188979.1 immunoglobulin heavy chain junction region [Mus musculus]MBK4188980.1 immunoglobulin heavy chain junction region [Mus musculus]MBK4188981.1 immunoglobulin heavy chain junction region [Mus musculus]MBK4188982.1 immunoglobulin heavy chain junction region [Mus musculus]
CASLSHYGNYAMDYW